MKIIILILMIITVNLILAQEKIDTYSIYGIVTDKSSGEAIPGATIKVAGENKGTYSSTRGKFTLPFLSGKKKLKIISIGYETANIDVDNSSDTLFVKLNASPVKLQEATVIGKIEPSEIIKRAIARKQENQSKLKTFKGLLYSKLVMDLDGNAFANSDGKSFSIGANIAEKAPDKYKMFVLESFSRDYNDYEQNVNFTEIIQRRQTANIQPDNNLLAIGRFLNMYDDEVNFISVDMTTPLSKNALDYYKFELVKREVLDDRYIYVLKVIPESKLFPLFYGTIKIVEGTYNMVELDLKPSESTAITFLDSLHIIQKFEEIKENIWHPALLEITGKAHVDIIKGFFDVKLDVKASSIYSEIEINIPLPDSIYNDKIKKLSVSPLADSADIQYWEKNSLRDISIREKEMYVKVDSLVQISDSTQKEQSDFNYDILNPFIDFNRVGSVSIGLSPQLRYKTLKLSSDAAFSFGLQKPIGKIEILKPFKLLDNSLNIKAGIFSSIKTMGYDDSFAMIINSAMAAFFHNDYYDYYKSDGWFSSMTYMTTYFTLKSDFENSRCFSLIKNTNRSIFTNQEWRDNPQILNGNYWTFTNNLKLPLQNLFKHDNDFELTLNINYLFGQNIGNGSSFNRSQTSLNLKTATFETGYNPMKLQLLIEYGNGNDLPLQYQHKAKTSLLFLSKSVNFVTMPYSVYEGKEYYAGLIKYNFTDILWRWVRLPLYEGRGLELVGNASFGKFKSVFAPKDWYGEAGFGFERIPTFMSNIFFLGAGAAWGFGPVAHGRFNWYLDITFPI